MQHTPIVEHQHVAGCQRIAPLIGRIVGHVVEHPDSGIECTHVIIGKTHCIAVVIVEGDLRETPGLGQPQDRPPRPQQHAIPLIEAGDTDAGQVIMDFRLRRLHVSRDPRPVNHDRLTALGLIIDAQQKLQPRRIMAVGAVGMWAKLLWRVGGIGHIFIGLELEQTAEDRLPDIADGIGNLLHRVKIARGAGQHRETMRQQPLEKLRDTTLAAKVAEGQTNRFRIEACGVPGPRVGKPHRVTGLRELGQEAGLVMRRHFKIRPFKDEAVAAVINPAPARPDRRVDKGGEQFTLVAARIKTHRIARIVAKPEIVKACRPAIDRQAELIITENKILQHRAHPSFGLTLTPARAPHKHRQTPNLVTVHRPMYGPPTESCYVITGISSKGHDQTCGRDDRRAAPAWRRQQAGIRDRRAV